MFERKCGLGTYVILNREGWVLTAYHLLLGVAQIHATYSNRPDVFTRLTRSTHYWEAEGIGLRNFVYLAQADLAVAQLEQFDPESVQVYPTLKNPQNPRIGSSLCRMGYPFLNIERVEDEQTGLLKIDPAREIPPFVNDCLFSRTFIPENSVHDGYPVRFLETSLPGFPGQSGGPVFDDRGRLWGIQSHSCIRSLNHPFGTIEELGEDDCTIPKVQQYAHIGRAIHPETLIAFLNHKNIGFIMSDD